MPFFKVLFVKINPCLFALALAQLDEVEDERMGVLDQVRRVLHRIGLQAEAKQGSGDDQNWPLMVGFLYMYVYLLVLAYF